MVFQYYLEQLRALLYTVPVILIAITFHEYAHGWVSEKLGDPTPRLEGRMSTWIWRERFASSSSMWDGQNR